MKARMIVMTLLVLSLCASALSLGGCNTWRGAGKDVSNTGESMQGAGKDKSE